MTVFSHSLRLLDAVGKRGYSVMYLTARSLGFDITTRDYLFKVSVVSDGDTGCFNLHQCLRK